MSAAIQFLQSASTATDSVGNATTFAAQSLGTAAADRKIVVAISCLTNSLAPITSVTVGGAAATILGQANTANNPRVCIAEIDLASGTTGDIVVTASDTIYRCLINVYRLTGYTGAGAWLSDTATPFSITVPVFARSAVVGIAYNGSNTTSTWTGLTEDADTVIENHTLTGGSVQASASGAVTAAVTYGAEFAALMGVAVWTPDDVTYAEITAGAIRYLPLQDNSGSTLTLADNSPAADGTLTNGTNTAAASVAGPAAAPWLPRAIQLDGVNDRISFPILTEPELTRPFLLASWVKSAPTGVTPIFAAAAGSFKIENNTQVILYTPAPSFTFSTYNVTGITNLRDGVWRHYAVLVGDTTSSLYIDGVLKATGTHTSGRQWPYDRMGQTESTAAAAAFDGAIIIPNATAGMVAKLVAGPPTIIPRRRKAHHAAAARRAAA